jgi:prevent-host-death family protein
MKTVNVHEAKTHLSKLIEQASRGEAFIIAKAGKPVVKVTALATPTGTQVRRHGFMAGQISVPNDFDRMDTEDDNSDHVVATESLPPMHKDPFDRILVAQATVEGITLLTIDSQVSQYAGPIRTV